MNEAAATNTETAQDAFTRMVRDPGRTFRTMEWSVSLADRLKEMREELSEELDDRSFEGSRPINHLARAVAALSDAENEALRGAILEIRAYFNSVTAESETA